MFRGYDAERERLVAIKLFTIELAPDRVRRLVGRFERLIASNLTHPSIAAPLAAGVSGPYFAHEFVAGESLDLAIREYGPAPASDALRVAAQLAGALDFAAAAGVYHGALHPRDVLLSADDTGVTGLGIAQSLEDVGVVAPVRRPYSAPERIAGADWDRRADIFSLAALIYELISGRRISGTGTHASLSLDDIPSADADALSLVFARALADNPADRYQTALSFVDALETAFGQPSTATSATRVEREAMVPLAEPEGTSRRDAIDPIIRPEPEVADIQLKPVASDVADATERRFAEIAEAEQERYRDVEIAPAIVGGAMDRSPLAARSLGLDERRSSEPPAPVLIADRSDRARSAMWPLVAALGIGLAMGFAGGYGLGMHDRSSSAAAAPAPPAGREFTESTIPEVRLKPDATGATTSTAVGAGTDAGTTAGASTAAGAGTGTSAAAPAANSGVAAPAANSGVRLQAENAKSASEIRPKPDAANTATPGRLLVRSTPAGARVSIDGRDGGVTPAVVRDLARGSHSVRVTRDGYIAEERRIVIAPRREAVSITVPLSPAVATNGRFVGDLTVQSRPTGAKVFLDGKLIGMTPLSIPAVRAGEHAVRLEYDGYRRWSSVVRVVANEANRVTASLER